MLALYLVGRNKQPKLGAAPSTLLLFVVVKVNSAGRTGCLKTRTYHFNICTISSTASLGFFNELLRVNLQGKLLPIRYTLRCWGQVAGLMCWGTRVTTWSQFHLDAFSHHPCTHGGKVSYSRKTQNSPCSCCCSSGPVPSQCLLTSVWSYPSDPVVFLGRGKSPKMA